MIGMHFRDSEFAGIPQEVTHVRLWDAGVHWGAIHLGPDHYDWSRLDTLVDQLHGKHITYVVCATPKWAAKNPDQPHFAPWLGPGSNSLPRDMRDMTSFVRELVTRYKGRINAYEIWNEPQLADFLYPYNATELAELAELTKRSRRIIHEVDPRAYVMAASVLPRPSSGGMKRARLYLEALKAKGWPVDGFTCHIYPEPDKGFLRWHWMLLQVQTTLRMMGASTSRVWVTESMFNLLGADDPRIPLWMRQVQNLKTPVWWYAWNRADLKGSVIAPGSTAWAAISSAH